MEQQTRPVLTKGPRGSPSPIMCNHFCTSKRSQRIYAHYENAQFYDAMHRAQQEAHYRPMRIVNGLTQVGQSGLALVALAGLLVSLHWMIAVVLLAAVVPGTLARLKYSKQLYVWQRQRTPMERQAWYFQSVLTGEAYAKEVRLFDLGELFIRRFRVLRETLRRERLRLTARRALTDLTLNSPAHSQSLAHWRISPIKPCLEQLRSADW